MNEDEGRPGEVDRLIDEEIQHVALLAEWKGKLP
jgi:hypothetical protein